MPDYRQEVRERFAKKFRPPNNTEPWHVNYSLVEAFIDQAISEAEERTRAELLKEINNIDLTKGQTGIAIGTKKAVIQEVLAAIRSLTTD